MLTKSNSPDIMSLKIQTIEVNIMFDYSKLRGLLAEKKITQREISSVLGISENAVSRKMNGLSEFLPSEIQKICNYINIPNTQVGFYFFTIKV